MVKKEIGIGKLWRSCGRGTRRIVKVVPLLKRISDMNNDDQENQENPHLPIKSTFCLRNIMATSESPHMYHNTIELQNKKKKIKKILRKSQREGDKKRKKPDKLEGDHQSLAHMIHIYSNPSPFQDIQLVY